MFIYDRRTFESLEKGKLDQNWLGAKKKLHTKKENHG